MPIQFYILLLSALISPVLPAIFAAGVLLLKKIRLSNFIKGILLCLTVNTALNGLVYNALYSSFSTLSPVSASAFLAGFMALYEFGLYCLIHRFVFSIETNRRAVREMSFSYGIGCCLNGGMTCFRYLIVFDHLRLQDFSYLRSVMNLNNSVIETLKYTFENTFCLSFLAIALESWLVLAGVILIFRLLDKKQGSCYISSFVICLINNLVLYLGSFFPELILILLLAAQFLCLQTIRWKFLPKNDATAVFWSIPDFLN